MNALLVTGKRAVQSLNMGCGCGKNTNVVMDGTKKSDHHGSSDFVSVPSTQSKPKQSTGSKPSTVQNSHVQEELPKAKPKESPKPVSKPLPAVKPKPELPVNRPESKAPVELPPVRNPKATPQLISSSTQPKTDTSTSPQVLELEAETRHHPGKPLADPKLQTQKSLGKTEIPVLPRPSDSVPKPEVKKVPEPISGKKPSEPAFSEKKEPEPLVAPHKPPPPVAEPIPAASTDPPALISSTTPAVQNKKSARSEEDKFPTQSSPHHPQPSQEDDTLTAMVHTDLQNLYSHIISEEDKAEKEGNQASRAGEMSREEAVKMLVREDLQEVYERVLRLKSGGEEEPMAKDYLQGLYSRVLVD